MKITYHSVLLWLMLLACGIWFGMLIFVGTAVAPEIFRFMTSKTQAGLLNGILLHKMNTIESGCAVLLLIASGYLFYQQKDRLRMIQLTCAVMLFFNLAYYSLVITPRMEELKQIINDFDVPITQDPRPERSEFDQLHKRYSWLVKLNAAALLAQSFLIVHSRRQDEE